MSTSVQINVEDREARIMLEQVAAALVSAGTRKVAGRGATNKVKTHLRKIDKARPNKLGGKRSNFYSRAAASTHFNETRDGVRVSITHTGFALRYHGGVVRPVRAKALAIPARPEVYGYRPREIAKPMFVMWRPGRNIGVLATRVGASLRIMYFLVAKATIPADPTLLPTEQELLEAIAARVEAYLLRQAERNGQP